MIKGHDSHSSNGRRRWRPRTLLVLVTGLAGLLAGAAAAAEPCNPVIDGTYCASQPTFTSPSGRSRSNASMPPIRGLGNEIIGRQDPPATLGGISLSNTGTRCIGLLRRGACN